VTFHGGTDIGWTAVESARLSTGMRDHSEFGGQHDGVAASFERPADELFVGVRPVHLCGVD
jgi:hypothetical protein